MIRPMCIEYVDFYLHISEDKVDCCVIYCCIIVDVLLDVVFCKV